ncbi:MAG: hypothetical protein A3C53_03590 [Omnitrophica WOR_2 bacterium RIFCSPHIGHO2_02_FULL_68_15]|nr:MAG: hypothetical protein A3C53_03590 [Omnitrophica WOR_2 bacterium RIFCSPHIGHO2_02_FULL_68_15]
MRTSVRRNQWKRWIREAFRRHPAARPPGCDIVVSVLHDEPGWQAHDVAQALIAAVTTSCRPS